MSETLDRIESSLAEDVKKNSAVREFLQDLHQKYGTENQATKGDWAVSNGGNKRMNPRPRETYHSDKGCNRKTLIEHCSNSFPNRLTLFEMTLFEQFRTIF